MIRVKLRAWTASFRFPTFQSGYQPTLPVPPPSTIQGILSAAKGEPVYLTKLPYVGYVFKSRGKGVDLEKIYALGKVETDIMKREFHHNAELYLYLPDEWKEHFKRPRYQLLLGRSSDLAVVEEIKEEVKLEEKEAPLGGTVVPIGLGLPGMVHALVVEYDYSTVPRRAKLVRPFIVLPFPRTRAERMRQRTKAPYDPELDIGVCLHRWSG
ncbi:type I-B CRISPR-associated protein Cas5 [Thermococcus celericrescens]|uniref:Type I-B CRISPR-associated protein Cas5 n=1 Tax=Thermococcus celericrescens TaxID=227598 RepID=A0A100XX08_9EURY|nr:type I-B CRISPR-associated protein Cas5b [Thermococcus celericrescens]KUH32848.1 type I-B CRISPR-associated protein Cas5 [Thermococcus celericrescens]